MDIEAILNNVLGEASSQGSSQELKNATELVKQSSSVDEKSTMKQKQTIAMLIFILTIEAGYPIEFYEVLFKSKTMKSMFASLIQRKVTVRMTDLCKYMIDSTHF